MGRGNVGRVGRGRARNRRRRQRRHQDRLQIRNQGDLSRRQRAVVSVGCVVYGLEERHERDRLLHRRFVARSRWLPARTMDDGRVARRHLRCRSVAFATAARQGQVVENDARAIRQVEGREPVGGGPDIHVRGQGRLVRGRFAGFSVRLRLEISAGGWLPGGLDNCLWRNSGRRTDARLTQP